MHCTARQHGRTWPLSIRRPKNHSNGGALTVQGGLDECAKRLGDCCLSPSMPARSEDDGARNAAIVKAMAEA